MDRCLAKDPAARFADAQSLKTALDQVQSGLGRRHESRWRPAIVVPVLIVLLAAAASGGWSTLQGRRGAWARGADS